MNKVRKITLITMLIALIIGFTGCYASSTKFSGSKTGNDNQFLVDFDVLNSTVNNDMPLTKGETIETTLDIIKGDVDILVESENGTIAYQGNNVKSGNFTIEIDETGNYTFYVTGSKAKGSVYFVKSSSDSAN